MAITPSEIDELRDEVAALRAVLTAAIRLWAVASTPPDKPLDTTFDAIRVTAMRASILGTGPGDAALEAARRRAALVERLVEKMRQDQAELGDPRRAIFSKGPDRPQ